VPGPVTGVNQIVWDPLEHKLYAKADRILDEHTRYALVVTTGVRAADGSPVAPSVERCAPSWILSNSTRVGAVDSGFSSYSVGFSGGVSASALSRAPRACSEWGSPNPISFLKQLYFRPPRSAGPPPLSAAPHWLDVIAAILADGARLLSIS